MKRPMKGRTLVVLVAIVLVTLIAWSGFYRIGQGEEALVLTFGRVTETHGPGLYWRIPFAQSVIAMSVTNIHTSEYGFRTTNQGSVGRAAHYSDVADEGVMLTGDNSIVSIEAIYQYTIRDVRQYSFDVHDPEGTLRLAFEAVIRRNIQNRTLDDALLNKEEIERQVLPDFQSLIDSYEMGVKINDVRIQNITVPRDVASSYEDVNNAKNEKTKRLDEAERYKNEVLPIARSNAYRVLQEAEGYKADAIAAAEADVAVFTAVYEEYKKAPTLMKTRLTLEALREVLGSSGKVVLVDSQTGVTKLMDVGDMDISTTNAAVAGGQ